MTEILAVSTSHRGCDSPNAIAVARAEALFASTAQPSESPAPDEVRRAVATTVRRLGVSGCAAYLAREFGDHPDTAAARMSWSVAMIRTVYPTPTRAVRTPSQLRLALAS
jgi:hypothetical protein